MYEVIPERLWFSARTHQISYEDCLALIHGYRLTSVVNLWHTIDERVVKHVPSYFHLSIPDGRMNADVAAKVERLVKQITAELDLDGRVLIHCWGGRNRSGMVAARVYSERIGVRGIDAVERIKQARKGALGNQHFVTYICEAR